MKTTTKQIIETALDGDGLTTNEERTRVLDALNEKPKGRPKLITRKQAAEILGCCGETVKRYSRRNFLREIHLSPRRVRLDESEVLDFARNGIQQQGVEQ